MRPSIEIPVEEMGARKAARPLTAEPPAGAPRGSSAPYQGGVGCGAPSGRSSTCRGLRVTCPHLPSPSTSTQVLSPLHGRTVLAPRVTQPPRPRDPPRSTCWPWEGVSSEPGAGREPLEPAGGLPQGRAVWLGGGFCAMGGHRRREAVAICWVLGRGAPFLRPLWSSPWSPSSHLRLAVSLTRGTLNRPEPPRGSPSSGGGLLR